MRRGRRRRVVTCRPPTSGYRVDWRINELLRRGDVPPRALVLWLHIRGLAWEHGACDATDAVLARLLGAERCEPVRLSRRCLAERGLLAEYRDRGVRWLVPLPLTADELGRLPPEARPLAEAQQARLAARLGSSPHSPHFQPS